MVRKIKFDFDNFIKKIDTDEFPKELDKLQECYGLNCVEILKSKIDPITSFDTSHKIFNILETTIVCENIEEFSNSKDEINNLYKKYLLLRKEKGIFKRIEIKFEASSDYTVISNDNKIMPEKYSYGQILITI